MLAARASLGLARRSLRRMATAAAPAAAAAPVDEKHAQWLKAVSKYPVVIPHFEWTLEFALPTPVPMHQFEQSPVVIEVQDRNPNADALIFSGPNVVGGYTHPSTGKLVTREEHKAAQAATEAEWHATHAGAR